MLHDTCYEAVYPFVGDDGKLKFFLENGEVKETLGKEKKILAWKPTSGTLQRFGYNEAMYGKFLSHGLKISDVLGKERVKHTKEKLNNVLKTYRTCNIDPGKFSLKKVLPDDVFEEFARLYIEASRTVFDRYNERPSNYKVYYRLDKLFRRIGRQKLNIHWPLDSSEYLSDDYYRNLMSRARGKNKIRYRQLQTSTGRFTTTSGSFPILNLKKRYKTLVKPSEGYSNIVEFDYNAAELRTFLAMGGVEQPQRDLHGWNAEKLGGISRSDAKKQMFRYIYGNDKELDSQELMEFYDKQLIYDEYADGEFRNFYGRPLRETTEEKFISHFNQSTFADLFSRKLIELDQFLKNKRARIVYFIHDSVAIEFPKSELKCLTECANMLSQTPFGRFPVDYDDLHNKELNNYG